MASEITITEALAEIGTLGKRISKKRKFVIDFLWRQERFKDPLEKQGGSFSAIKQERQAVADLEQRLIDIRLAIQRANEANSITIGDQTRSIAEWLVWRREVAPAAQQFLGEMRHHISLMRQKAQREGLNIAANTSEVQHESDVVVNIDEMALAREIEQLEDILGKLDGQLSLKNATVTITV